MSDFPTKDWRVQKFTEDGSFIVPSTVSAVRVSGCGGGGAGAGAGSGIGGGGGGSGVVVQSVLIAVVPGESIAVTIGAGGVGVSAAHGNNGGDTIFGSYLTLKGGGGGRYVANTVPLSGGTGHQQGGTGQPNAFGGCGGSTPFGLGAPATTVTGGGASAAANTGAGGAGTYNTTSAGGSGGSGVLSVEWEE